MKPFLSFHVHVIYQIIITFMIVTVISVIIQVMSPHTLMSPIPFYVRFILLDVLRQRTLLLSRIIRSNADYRNVPIILRLIIVNVLNHRH